MGKQRNRNSGLRSAGVGRSKEATRILAVIGAIALIGTFFMPVASADRADAANASDWDAGYLIDDAAFYDSGAMTAQDVQSFLGTKVTNCASGYTCLPSYGQATTSIGSDRYCGGYSGSGYESAAQIIDKVARSCGISQRVLIVLLEKEQGLVTSRTPSSRAYTAATGMACPDTAACDPNFGGFFYQVYYAARQFELYRLNPNNYSHRAGQWNEIRFSPNGSCGTKRTFIYNQATAGLYNYTPYTPNDAALANLYGAAPAGENCAAYGNRNFWRLFTDWFGNPRVYVVHEGLQSYWSANGGASGQIGPPTSYAVYVAENGEGWYQRFRGGNIYGSWLGGAAFVANNVILAEYNRNNGPYGYLGFPNGEQYCSVGKCAQSFVGATITTTPQFGAHVLWGGIRDYWVSTGGLDGPLGAALNDMTYSTPAAGAAWHQNFQGGVLVQGPAGFQLMPYSSILNTWIARAEGAGDLGWPTGPYECSGPACAQQFSGGILASTPWFGAQSMHGGFVGEWLARGGLSGSLGAPFGAMRYGANSTPGWAQNFTTGILTQSSTGFQFVPYGPGQAVWSAWGEERGAYGWSVGVRDCTGTGCIQEFSGGLISDSSWGAYGTFGGIAGVWKSQSGPTAIGPAVSELKYTETSGGGWAQHFAGGVITQSKVTGTAVFTSYGPILNMWYHYGAEGTWLGWPAGSQACSNGDCVQRFQNGVARSDPSGAVSFSRE